MNFTAPDARGMVEGFCLVKTADVKTSSKGDRYLDMTLTDASGEINAKIWSYSEAAFGEYAAGDIVKVRGSISVYAGNDQLKIERIRKANDSDNIDPAAFVPSAAFDGGDMYNAVFSIANSFEDEQLRRLVTNILEENRLALLYWPAAFKLHHAVRGGLLMHTLSIVRLAESVCDIYPFVDRELLLSGAILHDIAKITEFEVSGTGVATGYSVRGNLIGHLADGAMAIRKAAEKLEIPSETSLLLEHMVLSHHGEPEFGAAVRPMFIEAELLSELDLMDARIYEMREALEATAEGEFTGKLWALDNRKLFNHSRTDINKKINIL